MIPDDTEGGFCTAVNCMDGRVQKPVLEYLNRVWGSPFVDSVTTAGPVGLLAGVWIGGELAPIRMSDGRIFGDPAQCRGREEPLLVLNPSCVLGSVSNIHAMYEDQRHFLS